MAKPKPKKPLPEWSAVDRYITGLLLPRDPELDAALKASTHSGLPAINVSPPQGKLLYLLAHIQRAENILEIGTLGGYSTIWLARTLSAAGRLITLEFDPKHAKVAHANLKRAGLDHVVDIRVGAAIKTLPKLAKENLPPFDLIFIDADKESYAQYFKWALKLSRRGTLIIADNVVRQGEVINPKTKDTRVQGAQKFNRLLAQANKQKLVSATILQTVGSKGYDGFAIAIVL